MKRLLTLITALGISATAQAAEITGAGATFPYPIYAKWAEAYHKQTGVGLNYQSIGSSGGIRQINSKTVTFGATDAPVKGEDLDKLGQVQFPAIIGGTVPVVNLEGFKPNELRITGPVLAEVYMGIVTKWNDQKLFCFFFGFKWTEVAIEHLIINISFHNPLMRMFWISVVFFNPLVVFLFTHYEKL